jgi:hypothetical protein
MYTHTHASRFTAYKCTEMNIFENFSKFLLSVEQPEVNRNFGKQDFEMFKQASTRFIRCNQPW